MMYDDCGNSLFLLMMVDRLLVRNVADGYSKYNHGGCDATKSVKIKHIHLLVQGTAKTGGARVERLQVWPIQKAAPSAILRFRICQTGSVRISMHFLTFLILGKKRFTLWWWSLPSSWFWEILSD